MITIETQPKSPPRVWRLNAGRTRQFAAIENDHLLLSTPDKATDKIHRLPLQKITRIYIARERPAYAAQAVAALILLGALTMPLWGPRYLFAFYGSWLMTMAGFVTGLSIAVIAANTLYLNLRPKTLIYIVAGPQPWGVRVRLRTRKLDEFIDALSAGIIRCQSPTDGGVPPPTLSGERGEHGTPPV